MVALSPQEIELEGVHAIAVTLFDEGEALLARGPCVPLAYGLTRTAVDRREPHLAADRSAAGYLNQSFGGGT
jgi:hypothetical protein